MALSKEVGEAVAKIREMRDYIKADKEADKLRDKQLADAKAAQEEADSKLSALQAKLDAIPVNRELSQEDKDALQTAFDDAQEASTAATDAQANVTEVHDELKDAVPDNTGLVQSGGSQAASDATAAQNAQQIAEDRGREKEAGPQPVEPIQAPLMPTLSFDPRGSGPHVTPAGDGQPQQAPAIETAGGFVIQGGASTQRAPGSRPDSPSSSLIIPTDPDAKAPVSTADEVKSGLGDSRGNELIGNDGRPVSESLGMPREPTDAEREAAQKQQDLVAEEMARREANPLNLSPEDLAKRDAEQAEKSASPPQPPPPEAVTGSPATDKAADGGEKRGE